MPILGTIASGYVEPNFYWNRSLGGGSQGQDFPGGLILDSTNNVYLSSRNTDGSGEYRSIQSKFSSNGSLLWQRRVINALNGFKIAIDSSGNTYYCGTDSSSSGNNGILILKYNSSGTLQWQRNLGSFQSIGSAVGCDSSDNIYVFGRSNANGSYFDGIVAKYDSSGTIQWQRRLSPSTNNPFYVEGGSVDSSGNSYIVGSSSSNRAIIAKYNSSGTIQWQKQLYYDYGGASNANFTKSMTVDSSGNIYVGVSWSIFDSQQRNIVKYDSSGTLVWQKSISTTGEYYVFHGNMTTDSSGNLYVTFGEISDMPFFVKFDSSGNVIFMRKVSFDNGGSGAGGPIFISNAGDIYFAVNTSSYGVNQGRVELLKVPGDGSKTGSWTIDGRSYTYSAKTGVSFSDSSLTNSASTIYTDNSSSLSAYTPTLTETSASLATGFSLI